MLDRDKLEQALAALPLARRIRDTPSLTRLAPAKNLAGRWD